MVEQKLYPAKSIRLTAFIGLLYSLLVTVGFCLVSDQSKLGFSILYILSAIFLLCPFELLILFYTIENWNRWGNLNHRNTTFLCSGGVLLVLGGQLVFGFGFSMLWMNIL